MIKTIPLAIALAVSFSVPAYAADEYFECRTLKAAADANQIPSYDDRNLEYALCASTKGITEAVASGDKVKEDMCLVPGRVALREFNRRFPGRDPKSVAGKC
jgi:hypothetical protein